MHSNSMTVTAARVARDIDKWHEGIISAERLTQLLSEYGVNQEESRYRNNMVKWGYLYFYPDKDAYHVTAAGRETRTITVTVPRLNSKEVYNDLVQRYAGYHGLIEVGEAQE